MTHYYGTDDATDYEPNEAEVYGRMYGDERELEVALGRLKNKARVTCIDAKKKKGTEGMK